MIDWERVQNLRDEVGADSFRDVIALFLDEVAEVVARFSGAVDRARIEADLHFLRGGVLILGFEELGAKCHEGERLAAEGRGDEIDLGAIVALYEASRQEFLTTLHSKLAA